MTRKRKKAMDAKKRASNNFDAISSTFLGTVLEQDNPPEKSSETENDLTSLPHHDGNGSKEAGKKTTANESLFTIQSTECYESDYKVQTNYYAAVRLHFLRCFSCHLMFHFYIFRGHFRHKFRIDPAFHLEKYY